MARDKIGTVDADLVRVPRLIEEVAKGIAHEFWQSDNAKSERGVRSSMFKTNFPNEDWYVRTCWPHWIKDARHVLANMLGDGMKRDPKELEEIYDALTYGFDQRTVNYPPPSKLYQFAEGEPEPKIILTRH